MKKQLLYWMIFLLGCSLQTLGQKSQSKQIIGKWYNPYTYQSSGELKGFQFKRNGTCKALGIKDLELQSWRIENGFLIIEGFDVKEDGTREPYKTSERIDKLTSDTLSLVAAEKPFKMVFLYMPEKAVKKFAAKANDSDLEAIKE